MTKYLRQALDEWNRDQPAWKPILRLDQLKAAEQSVVEDRAENLELTEVYSRSGRL